MCAAMTRVLRDLGLVVDAAGRHRKQEEEEEEGVGANRMEEE